MATTPAQGRKRRRRDPEPEPYPGVSAVVTGGQTGVDQAVLVAARDAGLSIGGWCPPGRACESGAIPEWMPLRETPVERSSEAPDVPRSLRTQWNVRDSDATLILTNVPRAAADPGTEWTAVFATRFGKPLLRCDPHDPAAVAKIVDWLRATSVETLHVAGPRESVAPGIGAATQALLAIVFANAKAGDAA